MEYNIDFIRLHFDTLWNFLIIAYVALDIHEKWKMQKVLNCLQCKVFGKFEDCKEDDCPT